MTDELKTLDQVKHTVIDLAIKFGPKVLVALVFIVAGVVASHWAGRLSDRSLRRFHLEIPARQLLVRVVRICIVTLFIIMAVQNLGVELLPLIAGLGVAGAGIALAMQGVLGNLVAGLTVIFTRPFNVGEYISINTEEGVVESITTFNTVLLHSDLSRVVIPNRKVVGEILHNYGRIRQLEIIVSVTYGADLNSILSSLRDVLTGTPLVLQEPAPVIGVNLIKPSSVDIAVKPWVKVTDYANAGSEVRKGIIAHLRQQNIPLPVPQQEVRLIGTPS